MACLEPNKKISIPLDIAYSEQLYIQPHMKQYALLTRMFNIHMI